MCVVADNLTINRSSPPPSSTFLFLLFIHCSFAHSHVDLWWISPRASSFFFLLFWQSWSFLIVSLTTRLDNSCFQYRHFKMIRSCSFVAWLAAVFVVLTGSAFGERYCGTLLMKSWSYQLCMSWYLKWFKCYELSWLFFCNLTVVCFINEKNFICVFGMQM